MWRFVLSLAMSLLFLGCAEDIPELLTEEDILEIIGLTEPELPEPIPVPEPEPQLVESILINEITKVQAGGRNFWALSLFKGSKLHGEITSDTDVNVWLMSAQEYVAFKAGNVFSFYVQASSKRILEFTFEFDVPESGVYYFVLDNTFSWLTSKNVSVRLKSTRWM